MQNSNSVLNCVDIQSQKVIKCPNIYYMNEKKKHIIILKGNVSHLCNVIIQRVLYVFLILPRSLKPKL